MIPNSGNDALSATPNEPPASLPMTTVHPAPLPSLRSWRKASFWVRSVSPRRLPVEPFSWEEVGGS